MRVAPMPRWMTGSGLALLLLVFTIANGRAQNRAGTAELLLFDDTLKELEGSAGSTNLIFTFAFTNAAPATVVIESVRTSCGCTVARVPTLPWRVDPGERGEFSVALDARGKRGTLTKTVFVNTSVGVRQLIVRARLAESGSGGLDDDRARNMQIALADRSAIFRGDCASCHAKPADGKMGVALYLSACAVCHDSPNRATMVPDLKRLAHPTNRDHWVQWITHGKEGTLMPGFGLSEGGPLNAAQIDSLADYLTRSISDRRVAQTSLRATIQAPQPPIPPDAIVDPQPKPSSPPTSSRVRLPPLPVIKPPSPPSPPAPAAAPVR